MDFNYKMFILLYIIIVYIDVVGREKVPHLA